MIHTANLYALRITYYHHLVITVELRLCIGEVIITGFFGGAIAMKFLYFEGKPGRVS